MTREIKRLTTLFILAFGLVMFGTAYWTLFERDNLRRREDNPRRVLDELNIQRGEIVDREGNLLAYSKAVNGQMQRIYPHPEAVSAVGYYNYTFGAAGLEEGMNNWLSGDDFRDEWEQFAADILHNRVEGGDIQITLDLTLQKQLYEAMQGQNGGVLLVHVPSGQILAMVSQPAYDPNRIEEERLNQSRLNYLPRNRVTERQYQPGGALQTLILSELLATGTPLDKSVSVKAVELASPRLTLACEQTPPDDILSMGEAYLYACPAPFAHAAVNPDSLLNKFQVAGLVTPPVLDGLLLEETAPGYTLAEDTLKLEAAGQGDLTFTPLQAAQIIAAVVNHGNGVPLHLIQAIRPPDSDDWQPFVPTTPRSAIMQPAVALQIQTLLQQRPLSSGNVYGHISHAYAGLREYVWLLGWTPLENGEAVILVMVLEGKDITAETAIDIAVPILEAVR